MIRFQINDLENVRSSRLPQLRRDQSVDTGCQGHCTDMKGGTSCQNHKKKTARTDKKSFNFFTNFLVSNLRNNYYDSALASEKKIEKTNQAIYKFFFMKLVLSFWLHKSPNLISSLIFNFIWPVWKQHSHSWFVHRRPLVVDSLWSLQRWDSEPCNYQAGNAILTKFLRK